ncbi:hypothetical protein [Acinetobacter sp.]|uniref:hypothetical protein n=1 Tax=Acinetobacter sp. TaxID=472 RepID=UPI002FC692AE
MDNILLYQLAIMTVLHNWDRNRILVIDMLLQLLPSRIGENLLVKCPALLKNPVFFFLRQPGKVYDGFYYFHKVNSAAAVIFFILHTQ